MQRKLLVPKNINGITLGQYQKFLTISEGIEGEFLNQRIVEVFCNIPYHEVANIAYKDVQEIVDTITKILEDKGSFMHRFFIEGVEFGFIPHLEEITSGEFADLTNYISDMQELHKAMAVLFRPITTIVKDKYDIIRYEGTKEWGDMMKFMPLGAALGALVFFWNLTKDLERGINHSIKQKAVDMILAEQPHLAKSGVSINTSTHLLKEMLQNLTK